MVQWLRHLASIAGHAGLITGSVQFSSFTQSCLTLCNPMITGRGRQNPACHMVQSKKKVLYQTKNLLLSKGNYEQNEEETNEKRKKIVANHTYHKGLISKIYKESIQLNSQKI